ncbi:MAG: hypothetical protein ABEJ56_03120 [Candidatus Nanohaloarchaea archaeon]
MQRSEIFALVVSVAAVSGIMVAFYQAESKASPEVELQNKGEVHEHALFHVIINGSEVDFTEDRFQLNSRDVHLENNISDIVHRHEENVSWSDFLDTLEINYWRSNETGNLCVKIYNRTRCGEGKVLINGESQNDQRVIQQGDHFLIVMDTRNMTKVIGEYMKQQLPPDYKPQRIRGKRI